LKGGTANVGIVANPEKYGQYNYYAGFTVPTPLSVLKVGGAFDLVSVNNRETAAVNKENDSGFSIGGYANIQATDKLALNLRGEYFDLKGGGGFGPGEPIINPYAGAGGNGAGEEITATIAYNLWANVTSRAEFRWDHSDQGEPFGGTSPATPYANSYILALNVVYAF